jgi:hypothetical protein
MIEESPYSFGVSRAGNGWSPEQRGFCTLDNVHFHIKGIKLKSQVFF